MLRKGANHQVSCPPDASASVYFQVSVSILPSSSVLSGVFRNYRVRTLNSTLRIPFGFYRESASIIRDQAIEGHRMRAPRRSWCSSSTFTRQMWHRRSSSEPVADSLAASIDIRPPRTPVRSHRLGSGVLSHNNVAAACITMIAAEPCGAADWASAPPSLMFFGCH
jgi:hypothetical protein